MYNCLRARRGGGSAFSAYPLDYLENNTEWKVISQGKPEICEEGGGKGGGASAFSAYSFDYLPNNAEWKVISEGKPEMFWYALV